MRVIRIIIPVYKNPEQLVKCHAAIKELEHNKEDRIEVLEVDNNDYNRGFTGAVNEGMRISVLNGDEYAIILNQDCYLEKDFVQKALAFMDSHPKCAIAGPKQLSSENSDLIIHAGCNEAYPYGRHISGLVSNGDYTVSKKVPWVTGACMIVRVRSVIDYGLMDESMFLIGSDSDWCYTARGRGFEVWYIAECSCVHEQGVSSGTTDKKISGIMYLDMIYWRNKWIGSDLYRELSMEVFD